MLHLILQAVPTSKGQALADEYGIKFFETVSAKIYNMFVSSFIVCLKIFIFLNMIGNCCRVQKQTRMSSRFSFLSLKT